MKRVSVIVPVYNGRRTLKRCLLSIINQTYQEVEVVVVNDGSTDGSGELAEDILRSVALKKVVNKVSNEGLELARRTGISSSTGELITFVDSDDYIEHHAIEVMVAAMEEYQTDMVQCGMRTFLTVGHTLKLHMMPKSKKEGIKVIDKKGIDREYLSFFGCGSFSANVWSKLYKREKLENLKAGHLFFGEDLYLNMQVFPRLNSICILPNTLYHYERQGTTSRFMPSFMEDVKHLFLLKAEKAQEIHSDTAFLYSAIELRNCLRTHIESMILHKVDTEDGIKEWIAKELQDDTYEVFNLLKQQEQHCQSPVSLAIVNKDNDEIYNLCRESVLQWNWKKILLRILTRI